MPSRLFRRTPSRAMAAICQSGLTGSPIPATTGLSAPSTMRMARAWRIVPAPSRPLRWIDGGDCRRAEGGALPPPTWAASRSAISVADRGVCRSPLGGAGIGTVSKLETIMPTPQLPPATIPNVARTVPRRVNSNGRCFMCRKGVLERTADRFKIGLGKGQTTKLTSIRYRIVTFRWRAWLGYMTRSAITMLHLPPRISNQTSVQTFALTNRLCHQIIILSSQPGHRVPPTWRHAQGQIRIPVRHPSRHPCVPGGKSP